MPMKTRSQSRKEAPLVESVDIKVDDYEMDDMVSRFNKISSKDADLQELMVKMDKELNVSKVTLQKLYRDLNKTVPPISKLSLENIQVNQELDSNCILVQKYLSTHQENVKL